jgi:isocitrate lyase
MKNYLKEVELAKNKLESAVGIEAECVVRMKLQNRFKTGLDIAKYTARLMREDMDRYDMDKSKYTKSLGCWHGFIGQQKIISIKKHFESTKGNYLYLSGWMVAALRSEFGPLPDQSMHEKTSVSDLIVELYTFLKQADARELSTLFRELDQAIANGDEVGQNKIMEMVDNFETHVVPIIADIDAGFGNEEATYLLAKKMIEAGACCIQIENQVSDAKQCGHQDGKVTVPHEDFLAKIKAIRYAFLELGVDDGVIVARTDSLGAGLTQKIPVSTELGDLADQYNSFLDGEILSELSQLKNGEIALKQGDKYISPSRLPNGLFKFREGSESDRVVLDCVTSLQNGADLLWIETAKPDIKEISKLVNRIKEEVPDAKLVYNNSPSFNWTLNFRQEVYKDWKENGKEVSKYILDDLMNLEYDSSELAKEADSRIQNFHLKASTEAGVFHHLITLPTYHTVALSTDDLSKEYFGEKGMLAYVEKVQRKEIREGLACVKHQDMSGSNIGDDHKEYFSGDNALKARGKKNTMNQF